MVTRTRLSAERVVLSILVVGRTVGALQVLEEFGSSGTEHRNAVGRNIPGSLLSGPLHRRQLVVRVLLLRKLVRRLRMSLLRSSLLRMLSRMAVGGMPVSGMARRERAVARVAGDRIAVSVAWVSIVLEILLALPINEGLAVSRCWSRLLRVTVGLQRHSVGRVLLIRLRDVAGLGPGSCATVPVSGCCICCRRVTAGKIRPLNGWLAGGGMLNVTRSGVNPGGWILTSRLLGTVPDNASVLRVVAGLTVHGLRSLDRTNGEYRQRSRDYS